MKPSTSNQAVRSPLITTSPKKDVKGPSGTQSAPVGGATPKSFLGNWQEETDHSQGSADFAKLIHKSYLSDKEKILVDALTEYKRVGYKRTLFKIFLMICVCIFLLVFTVVSIGCWSEHLELIEHLGVYDERYVRTRKRNQSELILDCPMMGFIGSLYSPQSSTVDLFGKIISIISIRKLIQLIIRLIRSIRLKTTTEAEARKHVDETQKDLNGLAESIIETLCEV
ncbi:Ion_trans_2 domain-containing protein [Caenorhabditis elegans]|uniref:Ion_trans_2 domain-containing protein n=1 Tax=Caenorhabditis elegans TaxID=6239 RepID=O45081_CAEEL|nr:Ion_trans_2 domain-containing protein [Caenorhabditis elegans]CCD64999.1 Ion_trans_2 domain-containing protein [Caenorhabditis elegans]|eukprot:NP_501045.1 Uncharacterized protein CELE_C17H12.10 [Caenorhabditis elegans]